MSIAFYILLALYVASIILAYRLYKVMFCWGNMGVKGFRYCEAKTKYGIVRGFTHYNTYNQKVKGNLDWFIQIYGNPGLEETTLLFSHIDKIDFYPFNFKGFIKGVFYV